MMITKISWISAEIFSNTEEKYRLKRIFKDTRNYGNAKLELFKNRKIK